MTITTKDFSGTELESFVVEYARERQITVVELPKTCGCVMNDEMFDILCQEMDARINKMTKGVRMSVSQSGRSHVRPLLLDLIPMIPRIDERVVLAGAYQRVFGGVQ